MGDSEWSVGSLCRQGVFDQSVLDGLNELAAVAAHACAMPACLVCLVIDGRELVRAAFGVNAGEETPAAEACMRALRTLDVVVGPESGAGDVPVALASYAAVPMTGGGGTPLGALCVFDRVPGVITQDRLQAVRELARQGAEEFRLRCRLRQLQVDVAERSREADDLDRLFHLSLDMLCIAGFDGYFKRVNDAFERVLGYTQEELLARPFIDFVHPDDHAATREAGRKTSSGSSLVWFENRYICKDGSTKWLSWTAAPVPELRLIFAAARDTTEQRLAGENLQRYARDLEIARQAEAENAARLSQLVRELETAKTRAEKTARSKSDFLAGLSHEIRGAMHSISESAEFVLQTELNEEQVRHLGSIKDAAENLSNLTGNILDFSSIEAGSLDLERSEFSLRDAVEGAARALALAAQQKGLELLCDIRPGVPDGLIGDAGRLRQVLLILLGNAVKFTSRGEVILRVEQESESDDDVTLHVSVVDTGIGIPAERQTSIFEAFAGGNTDAARPESGAGLGLALAARILDMMRGQVWVESEPGRGSTFHVRFQFELRKGARRRPVARKSGDLRDVRVLVVDDNASSREVLTAMLLHWHMKAESVDGARAALTSLERASRSGRPFALALIDGDMPEVNGISLAGLIRRDPQLASTSIVMLLSAGARTDAARLKELGVVECLTKPVRQSELLHTSVRAVRGEAEEVRYEEAAVAQNARFVAAMGERELPAGEDQDRVFDLGLTLHRIGGDEQLLRDMIRLFREDSPRLLARVKRGLQAGDVKAFTHAIHTLKGATGNFIAPASLDAVRALEACAKERDLHRAAELCSALENELSRLASALRAAVPQLANRRRRRA